MSTVASVETISESHEPHWVSRAAFPVVSIALIFTQVLLGVAVSHENYWLAVPLALIVSHFMHGQLIGFHEASHGLLRKNRGLNEFDGLFIGIFSLMSFSLYRAAHQTHHMHLGTAKDEELWPFVQTSTPRWVRVVAAQIELWLGYFFTPFIFMRTFLRKNSPIRAKKVRRRIWTELIGMAVIWAAGLTAVAHFGVWHYFLWMYFGPALLAGNLQSWRKYIEHVGLTGSTVKSATRSIVADNLIGRLVSFTLLHEPYHGVHHLRAGITHAELPQYRADLQPETEDEKAPFPSYRQAFLDLFRCLSDPRVGPQWNSTREN